MSERWAECLDAFAEHLAAQRQAVAAGRPEDVRAYAAPTELGDAPLELTERLRALAQENDELVSALATATTSCARQLRLLAVLHRPEPSAASFVDSRD